MISSVNSWCNLDLDPHAIWQECYEIPTSPPCLANDLTDPRHILSNEGAHRGRYEFRGYSLIEGFSHTNHDNLSGFKWTGLDPLSISSQTSHNFLYVSAFIFSEEVHCIDFRLPRFDRTSGETIGEDLFFLLRFETALGIYYNATIIH